MDVQLAGTADSGGQGSTHGDATRLTGGRTPVMVTNQMRPDRASVFRIAEVLRAGGVVCLPTDTVYGVSMAVLPGTTPQPLFEVKQRDPQKAIPLLVGASGSLEAFALDVPEYGRRLSRAFWPGALTLVVRASSGIPEAYRAADGTVALRAPASPLCLALVEELGCPLATSSANTQHKPAPCGISSLERRIMDHVDLVVDGGVSPLGSASSIVSCLDVRPRVLRDGAIPQTSLLEVCSDD